MEGEGIAKAPTNWKTFTETIPSLTIKEKDLTLRQSGAALGTFKNITHAKDLLALLFLQTNNSFVTNGADGIKTHFGAGADQAEENSAENAVNFYMGFSDPSKDVYTWNSGMPRDREAFIQSSLAYYFGYASDLPEIRRTNPNLHFDVAIPPQSGFTTPLTTGIFYGLAMPKGAPNNLLSYSVATTLAGNAVQKNLALNSAKLTLMPVRRDVIADSPKDDPYLDLFYKATLVMHSWFDPDPKVSNVVFGTLISDIMSGALRTDLALAKAGSSLISQTSSSQ